MPQILAFGFSLGTLRFATFFDFFETGVWNTNREKSRPDSVRCRNYFMYNQKVLFQGWPLRILPHEPVTFYTFLCFCFICTLFGGFYKRYHFVLLTKPKEALSLRLGCFNPIPSGEREGLLMPSPTLNSSHFQTIYDNPSIS